jgi:hypothetical protein
MGHSISDRLRVRLNPRDHRYAEAYLAMVEKARYRPRAPGDGIGSVLLTRKQLRDPGRLEKEALDYVKGFVAQEDTHSFWVGCTNFETNRATIYAIEAARCLCGGADDVALRLLQMAIDEIRRSRQPIARDTEHKRREAMP